MPRIKRVENVVFLVLSSNEDTREDDYLLFKEVLANYIDVNASLANICENHIEYRIPSLETITRCRRKLQAEYPELKPSKLVQDIREDAENDFINYARGVEE